MDRPLRGAAAAAVLSMVMAGLALAPSTVASADTNMLPNPTFGGGSTSGWKGTNATLSVASPGFDTSDSYAAQVTLSNTSTSYAIYASPRPATSVAAGTQLQGTGEVLGVSGKSICLLLQEYTSGGSLVQTQQACVTASGSWQAIGPAALTAKNAGDSVGFRIRQTGAVAGNSFQADALSLTESSPPPPPPPPGVTGNAANWPMQETSGTTMADVSGNGNDGTLFGPVKVGVTPGPPGFTYAYSFPGNSPASNKSTVDVPFNQALVAGSANIDISFWFNTTHLPSSGDYDLVRMGDYPFPEYKVELVPANQIECTYHHSSTGGFAQGGSNLNDGQWHFVQCVKTATQVQVWIDGAEVASKNVTIGDVSPSQDVFIGAHGLPGTSSGFDWYQGELSDVEFSFSSPAAGASGSPAATAPAGSTAAGPLTMKQAKATYARIVGPGNALANKLGDAASGTAPFSEFRSDALAYVSELRAEIGKLQAVQWPAQAQSRINALIKTTYPADIGCLQAVAAAGSTAAAQDVSSSNKDCQVADNSPIPTSL